MAYSIVALISALGASIYTLLKGPFRLVPNELLILLIVSVVCSIIGLKSDKKIYSVAAFIVIVLNILFLIVTRPY